MLDWKSIAVAVLMVLFALAAYGYVVAMRRWRRRLIEVASSASDAERARFMESEEYRRLRGAARRPIVAATLLFLALYVVLSWGR